MGTIKQDKLKFSDFLVAVYDNTTDIGVDFLKILKQIGMTFLLCLLGELITQFLPFAFPAGVLCMILLFLLFLCRLAKTEFLRETSDFLLENMALFFVPAGVGIIQYYDIIKSAAWQIFVICVISTFVTFAATAYTVRLVTALQKKMKRRGDKSD